MKKPQKTCITCKWHETSNSMSHAHYCTYRMKDLYDNVTGEKLKIYVTGRDCNFCRSFGTVGAFVEGVCGEIGRFWEPIDE